MSLRTTSTHDDIVFVVQGRSFTLYQLKQCVIAACGGVLNGFYTSYDDMAIWEVIEAIEATQELNSDSDVSQDETGDWLESMASD